MDYEIVIGLEVHTHLKTRTKAFCGCSTLFGSPANTQVCPVCLGLPGSLPVLNEKLLEYGVKTGLALNCRIPEFTKFDRKHYFYPDLPKNYQISQYDLPLAVDGFLEIELSGYKKKISIKRVHMEEDAGKLIHDGDSSLVDYNRAGMPLLEIVSEPQINSPDEAYEYLTGLKAILKYLEVSDCDMEKGSLRCDANISLRPQGAKELGIKTELKNLNSFKAVRDALIYEAKRQKDLLEAGQRIIQQTLLWDDASGKSQPMRNKEEAMDYRYFPEPDLPPFVISRERIQAVTNSLPELPAAFKERLIKDYGLGSYEAGIMTAEKAMAGYFEAVCKVYPQAKTVSNWLIGQVAYELNSRNLGIESLNLSPEHLAGLLAAVEKGKISNLAAKDVLTQMLDSGKSADSIIEEKGLAQISDSSELSSAADKVIAENAKSVRDYKSGKANALMFLLGQVMKQTKGKANPKVVQDILKEKLSNA